MVEVFKTNVTELADAELLIGELHKAFPFYKVNFDLDDCDNILRIESEENIALPIIDLLKIHSFDCEELE